MKEKEQAKCNARSYNSCLLFAANPSRHCIYISTCHYSCFPCEKTWAQRGEVSPAAGVVVTPRSVRPQSPRAQVCSLHGCVPIFTNQHTKMTMKITCNHRETITVYMLVYFLSVFPPCMRYFIQLGFPLFHKCLSKAFLKTPHSTLGLFKFGSQ